MDPYVVLLVDKMTDNIMSILVWWLGWGCGHYITWTLTHCGTLSVTQVWSLLNKLILFFIRSAILFFFPPWILSFILGTSTTTTTTTACAFKSFVSYSYIIGTREVCGPFSTNPFWTTQAIIVDIL